jgi:hypothetical protein
MARNALEAVFGALGGGLVGYGKDKQNRYAQEQDAIDREERRKRTELADVLKAAEMVQSGSYGTESQLQARQQRAGLTAMQAALFAATAGKGPPSAAPMPTDVARAVPQLRRGMDAPSVSIGGQNLRLLETETDRARIAAAQAGMDRAARRTEGREDAVFESGLRTKEQAAAEAERRTTTAARLRDTGLDPNTRLFNKALDFIAKGIPIPGTIDGTRSPTDEELTDFVNRARRAEQLAFGKPVDNNSEIVLLRRQRDEAIRQVDARAGYTPEQKTRAKERIEVSYTNRLASLGPR